MKKQVLFTFILSLMFSVQMVVAQSVHNPTVDMEIIEKIKTEGIDNSQIMDIASWLTDVYGPRLTNSRQMNRANQETMRMLTEFGAENAHLHKWGPFGTGWELKRFSLHATTEYSYFLLTAFPKAWTPGHRRAVKGDVVFLTIESEEDFEKYRGKLKGKFVMIDYPQPNEPAWNPIARRHDSESLLNLANAAERPSFAGGGGGQNPAALARAQMRYQLMKFIKNEQPAALLDYSYRGYYGQIAISAASVAVEPGTPWGQTPRVYSEDVKNVIPQVSLTREHYGRLFRLLEKGVPVEMEMELQVEFQNKDLYGYNTIAEIPGTDPELKDEIVMLGGHLDSWHSGTGATDNGAGSAVMMEAMRILKAIGVEPRRTIRIGLWSGEEQGLHGSREYVYDQFARPAESGGIERQADYENFSAYYNIDNGGGQVRGIYLQQNEQLRQLFRVWLQPFSDWDATTVSFANTGGTDHQSFDRMGLPGFQFIQDPMEYFTMTHHSNQDVYERLVEQDMQRTAIIVAAFVYHTAMLDERLPRKGETVQAPATVSN